MKKFIFSLCVASLVISCNKKNEVTNTSTVDSSGVFVDEASATDSTLVTSTSCYMQVTGKDTLFAQIDDNLGTVTGKLHYKNFQKDSSFGDIMGSSSGDTIKVDYTFQSEGMLSTNEIWFLKKDGKLYEGIGEPDKTGERYADYKKIKFEGGHILDAVDCKTIEKKFPEFTVAATSTSPEAAPTATKASETSTPKTEPKAQKETTAKQTTKTDTPEKNTAIKQTETKPKTTETKK